MKHWNYLKSCIAQSCKDNEQNDEGQAILIVLSIIIIISLLAVGIVTSTVNLSNTNFRDVAVHESQNAAEAGVASFESFLRLNPNAALGNPSQSNPNPTCPQCASFNTVPNSSNESYQVTVTGHCGGGATCSTFQCEQYAVTSHAYCILTVTITGKYVSGGLTQVSTVTLTIKQNASTFLQYAVYDNYWADDPADSLSYGSYNGEYNDAVKNCAIYQWSKTNLITNTPTPNADGYGPNTGNWGPRGKYQCSFLFNGTGFVFNGPFYAADSQWVCGSPVYNGFVTTGDPIATSHNIIDPNDNMWVNLGSPYWSEVPYGNTFCSGYNPRFNGNASSGNIPDPVGLIAPPPQLTSLSSDASYDGCLYTGPTVITVHNNATMTVYSPDTISISGYFQSCGTPGPGNCLSIKPGCTVPIPQTTAVGSTGNHGIGVVYVQNVPTSEQGSVSYCPNVNAELLAPSEMQTCKWRGDLLIQGDQSQCRQVVKAPGHPTTCGEMSGAVTFGSDGNIVLTGNMIYQNSGGARSSQSLGLAGTYFVTVNVPGGNGTFGHGSPPPKNLVVEGAILAAKHSFSVDDILNVGNLGNETVFGSQATDFNAITCFEGGSLHGYCGTTTNTWDQALLLFPPPQFPQPVFVNTQYAEG